MRYAVSSAMVLAMLGPHRESQAQNRFTLREKSEEKKIEVLYDGKLVTAYCYFDSTEKPVLFPLRTVGGVTITRGYPVAPRAGERTDHPHHAGLWLNYESVNDLDFWNNSRDIPAANKHRYGSIRHRKVISSETRNGNAALETISHWVDKNDSIVLVENTKFIFSVREGDLIIDRIAVLQAQGLPVVFSDTKDGMLGLRVARELEMPSQESGNFIDASGNVTSVPQMTNAGVTGMYVSANGLKGDSVWGTRARWTALNGRKDGQAISIVMIDHPLNAGYPTYWHARGYGLFAANPLGQKIFSKGKEQLNFTLARGERAIFRYRIIIHGGKTELPPARIDQYADDFARIR
jgi:hypothetical protein